MIRLLQYLVALGLAVNMAYANGSLTPHVFLTSSLNWQQIPGMPPGAKVAIIDGNPYGQDSFVVRVKIPANYSMPMHSHSIDEYYTVLSGTYYLGIGNKVDRENSLILSSGSFIKIPALLTHYGWTKEETIIQIHGIGPHGLEYHKNQDQLNTILP
jgi:mannose-6-phosphate isomerase-like protein (cupin superfamily)